MIRLRKREGPDAAHTVLTIAGSDSSGGAGVEADLKTFTAHKCHGVTCITALTAQNSTGIRAVVETPREQVQAALGAVMEEFLPEKGDALQLAVVKTGMLTQAAISVVAETDFRGVKMVVDPVMVSTSGETLADDPTMTLCMERIIPRAFLCTPNMDEALKMSRMLEDASGKSEREKEGEIARLQDLTCFAAALHKRLRCENLLLKGGHIPFKNGQISKSQISDRGDVSVVDVLVTPQKVTVFKLHYIESTNTHGTGCTLSSAIAANIAKGHDLESAVGIAIDYIHGAMCVQKRVGLNHGVESASTLAEVSASTELGEDLPFYALLKSSLPNWKQYTQHRILSLIATDALPKHQFRYFLAQDYFYLVNYARIQGYAISVAENTRQIQSLTATLHNILEELKRHVQKIQGVEEGVPGRACRQYCDYLTEIGQKEDILGITVALAPCLHGYAEAGAYGLQQRNAFLKGGAVGDQTYSDWLADYTSEWYVAAHRQGMQDLQALVQDAPDASRIGHLRTIFDRVTDLEVAFWDEVLAHEG